MDPALHVRRGHGQRCVFSARGVGTVCTRCVAEVLSLTGPEPLTQRDHASVLALPTTRARYARALAELVRDPGAGPDVADAWGHVLVAACVDAIVADDANDPEAVTAPCVESAARLARTSARVDGGELLDAAVDRVLAHLGAPSPDASSDEALPAGVLGLPSPPGGASHHAPPARASYPALASDPRANPPATRRNQPPERDAPRVERVERVSREDRLESRGPPSPPRAADQRDAHFDPRDAYRDSQSTASHAYRDLRESQNSVGAGAPPPCLVRRQPGAPRWEPSPSAPPPRSLALFEDVKARAVFFDAPTRELASVRLLRLLAALLRLDLGGGDFVPSSFREPAPAPGLAPAPGVAAIAERLAAETPPAAFRAPDAFASGAGEAPGAGADFPARARALETRLAALDAAAAFVARADAGNVAAIASLRAANAAAATALARGAAAAAAAAAAADRARGTGFFPRRDPEDALVLALEVIDALARHCGVDLEAMTSPAACGSPVSLSRYVYASPGWTNARPSPLAETLRAGALFPSPAARAAACACLSSAVAGQSPAAVARLVRDDVLEHVFEVLRDASRERSELSCAEAPGRPGGPRAPAEARLFAHTTAAATADAARRGALTCLLDVLRAAAPDPEAAHACSTRMACGVDVLAAALTRSVRERDAETAAAAARLARAVAELGDPGSVAGSAAGRLADALLDAYEAFPGENGLYEAYGASDHESHVPLCVANDHDSGASLGGYRRSASDLRAQPRAEACAAVAAMLAWPSLADAAAAATERGDRAETSERARRVFERLAEDVARNLRGFGEDEGAREGVPRERPGSPYASPGGRGASAGTSRFAWDLPAGAADAMCAVLCDHFQPEDTPVAERILRERGMHEALAGALLRLAASREAAARRTASSPPPGPVERAVAAAVRAFGSLLATGAEPRADPTPFDGDPSESEATVDGTGATVAVTDSARGSEMAREPRTRLARDAVKRGVLAAAVLAADAGALAPGPLPGPPVFIHSEDDEETVDGLLENFVSVLLTALDDPACCSSARAALCVSASRGEDRYAARAVPSAPSGFAGARGGADFSDWLTYGPCIFAHVKYGDSDVTHGAGSFGAEAGRRLLARFASELAAAARSTRDVPAGVAADDSCLLAFAAAAATRGAGVPSAAETVDDAALETVAWRVVERARAKRDAEKRDGSLESAASSGYNAAVFASFAAFLRSGSPEAARATDLLASVALVRDESSPATVARDARRETSGSEAVACLLLKGTTHHPFSPQKAARLWVEARDAEDETAGKFLEGARRSAAAVALLVSRACARSGRDARDAEKAEAEVTFSASPFGPARARWAGCDEANAAMDASLFILSRRPSTPAVRGAAGRLWTKLGESAAEGPVDASFVDAMTLASMCALVELDEPSAARDPAAGTCIDATDEEQRGEGDVASFAARAGPVAVAALARFSPSGVAPSSPASRSRRASAVATRAFGAAATARALAAVLALAMRKQAEGDPRYARVASLMRPRETSGVSVADAAREALRDWHVEAAAAPTFSSPPPTGGDEARDASETRLRLVREARRAAIDLVRVTAAAGAASRDRAKRADAVGDGAGTEVFAILSDIADDPTDGVAALDALAAWTLAETPGGVPRVPGSLSLNPLPSAAPLVLQSGRAAMCAGSEAARDAGAACLWAALRFGEPGETSLRAFSGEENVRSTGEDPREDPRDDDKEAGFEDVETWNWEVSLLEDWLGGVDLHPPPPLGATRARAARVSSTRPSVEGRLRLAATLARVAPAAFETKVARSPEAARRLFRRAVSSGIFETERSVSPGALASLRALVDAGAARQLNPAELAGVRAACAEARHACAELRRDERGFRKQTGYPHGSFAPGATFSARVRGGFVLTEPRSEKEGFATRAGDERGNAVFGFGALATATPRWFPGRGADSIAALDALVADLDEATRV